MDTFKFMDSYSGNHHWLKDRTIFACKHGSHAYGTNRPESDLDVRGVFVAPPAYYHGFVSRVEQVDSGFADDVCLFEVRKYFGLAADCNPNVIELLFVDFDDWLVWTPLWEEVVAHRDLFLSQNAKHRFCGYAVSQLKRIDTHRGWLLSPPTHQPTRAEYGLPDHTAIPKDQRDAYEAVMLKVIEEWQVDFACVDDATRIDLLNKLAASLADMKLSAEDQYVAAGKKVGISDSAMEYLKSERAYRAALARWTQYQTWLKERNPVRAALEKKAGYDTKHAMHLVRLMRMAREILEGKGVLVKRPDAGELLAIRDGAWTYDQLREFALRQDAELSELLRTTKLPKQPDRVKLDALCCRIVESMR